MKLRLIYTCTTLWIGPGTLSVNAYYKFIIAIIIIATTINLTVVVGKEA